MALPDLSSRIDSMNKQIDFLREITKVKAEHLALTEENKTLKGDIERVNERVTKLRSEKSSLERRLETMALTTKEQFAGITAERDNLKARLDESAKTNDALKAKCAEMEKQLERFGEFEQMVADLQESILGKRREREEEEEEEVPPAKIPARTCSEEGCEKPAMKHGGRCRSHFVCRTVRCKNKTPGAKGHCMNCYSKKKRGKELGEQMEDDVYNDVDSGEDAPEDAKPEDTVE